MILNPQEEFVIARQLNDPADVSTNYVRAYVRNAKTDALIATLNLEDKGSQRFTKTWQVVPDPTGLGLYITITTKVFTDSGYTVASTTYGVEQTELLIQDRINPFLSPVGPDIDYKKIRKIVVEELEKLPKPIEPEKFDYETLAKGLETVISEVKGIQIPETDLRPTLKALEALERKIINRPEFKPTDLSPILKAINDLPPLHEEAQKKLDAMLERIKQFFLDDVEDIKKATKNTDKSVDEIKTQLETIDHYEVKIPEKKSVLKEYLREH